MPLFQHQPVYTPDQAFTNLFRLIDGFDNYSREVCNNNNINKANNAQVSGNSKVTSRVPAGQAASTRAFNPRFDVRETESAYELHGELAGLDRNNVSLEFSDPQTLVVSGHIERNYESEQPQQQAEAAAPAPAPVQAQPEAAARSPSLNATVEDEDTDSLKEVGEEAVLVEDENASAKEAAAAAAATPKESAVTPTNNTTTAAAAAKPVRYWYRERSVGQFRRVFEFPVAVNEDAVKASLDNGILSVTIPKAAKRQAKRISVF